MSQSITRIAFVIPTLDQSGAEKQLAMLASGLPADQYEPLIIALNRGGPYEQQLKKAGIPVQILNKRLRFDPFAHRRLGAAIKDFGPDIVHSWLFSANSHVRMLKNSQTPWKCVVSQRCVDSWKSNWQLWLDRKLTPRTDALVANSQSVANFYAQFGQPAASLHVINNGIELPDLLPEADKNRQRSAWLTQWEFPEDAFVVGFAGRLAKQKQLPTLLWAEHLLKMADRRIYAMIAGDGPEIEELRELAKSYEIESHIRFVGHQSDMTPFYKHWDALWLASQFGGNQTASWKPWLIKFLFSFRKSRKTWN
ncbi:MAG: glycosyltransferase [Planctomycetaceae bacterium]|nr:glycosyltransferase [Planctomycetaceae bacterium]